MGQRLALMREEVEVQVGVAGDGSEKGVAIMDRKSGRAWTGTGATESEAATEAMRKFLGDRRVREYME